MITLWLLALLLARPLGAVTLGGCDRQLTILPGHSAALDEPLIVIRGVVRCGRISKSPRVGFYVDDLDVDHREVAGDGEGRSPLEEGDRIFLMNDARDRVTGVGHYHERTLKVRWTSGTLSGDINVPEPTLCDARGVVMVTGAELRDLVGAGTAALVVRTLDPVAFRALKLRVSVLEARRWAQRAEPDVSHRVTDDVAHVLRGGERALEGQIALAYEKIAVPAIDWRRGTVEIARQAVITRLSFGDEAAGYAPLARGDVVYFVDADERLLMRWTAAGLEFTTAPPFTTADLDFARMLGRARRVVVVRRN